MKRISIYATALLVLATNAQIYAQTVGAELNIETPPMSLKSAGGEVLFCEPMNVKNRDCIKNGMKDAWWTPQTYVQAQLNTIATVQITQVFVGPASSVIGQKIYIHYLPQ